MLRLEGVSKSYGDVRALSDVALSVSSGEIRCLLGRNGAGKSTLVKIATGLLRPDQGVVELEGRPVRPWDRKLPFIVGLAPQELGLYPLLTVEQTLRSFAELYGLRGDNRRGRIDEIVDRLELAHVLGRMATNLSGGEKRRLHTAVALLHSPRMVLLDEPTAGADVQTRTNILNLVRSLAADGAAVLYSTHNMAEVELLDASVSILHEGRVIADGRCRELVERFGKSYVELRFDGPAPVEPLPAEVSRTDSSIRVEVKDVGAALVDLPRQLVPADRDALASVDSIRSSLEGVFVGLTGRRYEDE